MVSQLECSRELRSLFPIEAPPKCTGGVAIRLDRFQVQEPLFELNEQSGSTGATTSLGASGAAGASSPAGTVDAFGAVGASGPVVFQEPPGDPGAAGWNADPRNQRVHSLVGKERRGADVTPDAASVKQTGSLVLLPLSPAWQILNRASNCWFKCAVLRTF